MKRIINMNFKNILFYMSNTCILHKFTYNNEGNPFRKLNIPCTIY